MNFSESKIFVFVDFDGTIMTQDTSDELFRTAGGFEENLALLKKKEINIFEYWKRFAESISKKFTLESLENYIVQFEPDNYFSTFYELCQAHSLPMTIVSDNFDLIVRKVLEHHKMKNISFYVNKLDFIENKFIPSFPFASEGCEESTAAVCKRNIILNQIPDDAIVIYIGDGYSDYGAAEISDVIFAKKSLAKYCAEKRIPHHTFKTFFDIKQIIEKLLKKKGLRSRYQAQLARKKIFEME